LQRQIIKHLEKNPQRSVSRRELEEVLVGKKGHTTSNVLRAVRSLEKMYKVSLQDKFDKDLALVSLPRTEERLSEDYVFSLLRGSGVQP
jgi:hypothetical protein